MKLKAKSWLWHKKFLQSKTTNETDVNLYIYINNKLFKI